MRLPIVLLALGLLAVPVQASALEDLCDALLPGSVCTLQRDFNASGDAPSGCLAALAEARQLVVNQTRYALLLPVDDEADSVRLPIAPSQVNQLLVVTLRPSNLGDQLFGTYHLQGFTPNCAGVLNSSNNQIQFRPTQARDHVFRVTLDAPLDHGDGEPGADACHPFCELLNPLVGYGLQVQ